MRVYYPRLFKFSVPGEDLGRHRGQLRRKGNQNLVIIDRFDANHELSNIRMDAYDARQDIRVTTRRYLKEQETKALLKEVKIAIATDYLNNQTGAARNTKAADSTIDESHP